MAESQAPYAYDAASLQSLKKSLSEPRFTPYLTAANGHETYAFALYLWNARLAKSLLFPLGVTEVTVRNAIDETLVSAYGHDWHIAPASRARLNSKAVDAIDKALLKQQSADRGRLVAELTFDYWSNMLRSEYGDLWRTRANVSFPNLVHKEGRQDLEWLAKDINRLRNRVAHHEPILNLNLPDVYAKMIRLTELRCKTTAAWMKSHGTLDIAVRSRPKNAAATAADLASRMDDQFLTLAPETALSDLIGAGQNIRPIVVVDGTMLVGAVTPQQVAQFIIKQSTSLEGMIDLNAHTIGEVLAVNSVGDGWTELPAETPLANAIAVLQKKKTSIVVGTDGAGGKPLGVIMSTHRRY